MTLGNERILCIERGSTRSHCVENLLLTCRERDCSMAGLIAQDFVSVSFKMFFVTGLRAEEVLLSAGGDVQQIPAKRFNAASFNSSALF